MLASGLVLSRFGLWLFDLSVGQMLQERVPNREMGACKTFRRCRAAACIVERSFGKTCHASWFLLHAGVINGVQSSLQNLLQALSYAAGLVLWRPEHFVWLMLGSVCMVTGATALYTCFVLTTGSAADDMDADDNVQFLPGEGSACVAPPAG